MESNDLLKTYQLKLNCLNRKQDFIGKNEVIYKTFLCATFYQIKRKRKNLSMFTRKPMMEVIML